MAKRVPILKESITLGETGATGWAAWKGRPVP